MSVIEQLAEAGKKESRNDRQTLKWYPLYTRSRFEKKSYDNLVKAGFEAFLPLQKTERKWSDRKKVIDAPLFSSYVFVHITQNYIHKVLQVSGIVRYIQFNGRPATVRDNEIELIRSLLDEKSQIEVVDGIIREGAPVTVNSGLLKGYTGKVIRKAGASKLVIEVESINKSLLVTIDSGDIKAD